MINEYTKSGTKLHFGESYLDLWSTVCKIITNSSIPSVLNSFFQVFVSFQPCFSHLVNLLLIFPFLLLFYLITFSNFPSPSLHCSLVFLFTHVSSSLYYTSSLSPIPSLVPLPCHTFLSFLYIFQYLILSSTEISFLSSSKSTIYFLLFRFFLLFCLWQDYLNDFNLLILSRH